MVVNVGVKDALGFVSFHQHEWLHRSGLSDGISYVWLAVSTGVASILFFFSVYYILPNRKVPWRPVLRTSIITGVIWLLARFIFALAFRHSDLSHLRPVLCFCRPAVLGVYLRADPVRRSAVQRGAAGEIQGVASRE